MDIIKIDKLRVYAYHGVLESEKKLGQNFYISISMYLDTQNAGLSDDLGDSISYADVCQKIYKFTKESSFNLIEALAENIAQKLLLEYSTISKVKVVVDKPNAPIVDRSFKSVNIEINRSWHSFALSIGSNIGDKKKYLTDAMSVISSCKYFKDVRCSDIISTAPYGYSEQDDFLNAAIIGKTVYSAKNLLHYLNDIENKAGRKREIHWGPRTLDLDIIFYDNLIINSKKLIIPHPDMHNRVFVLKPLNQLIPNYIHPVFHKNINQLYKDIKND